MSRKFQITTIIASMAICLAASSFQPFFAKADEIKIEPYFKDVQEGYRYYTAIQYLKSEGLIDDSTEENFNPDAQIARAEAVRYIMNVVLGYKPTEKISVKPFTDMPIESSNAIYIEKAKELKLVNGYDGKRFQPNKKVALSEAIKIALETGKMVDATIEFKIPEEDVFADVPTSTWFAKYAKIAKERRIIRFGQADKMDPDEKISKGYLMEILYRMKKYYQGNIFGIASFYSSGLEGFKTSSGEKFSNSKLTAAHKTLKLGTVVRVTNLQNSKSVDVVINDRGPYTKNFEIDLSQSAFNTIGLKSQGLLPVQIDVLQEIPTVQ